VLNQRVGAIRVISDSISQQYLFLFLNSDQFEKDAIRNSFGIAQLNLSSKWVENYEIPLPPLDDQIRIATLLSRVEALIATRKENLRLLDEFLKSNFLEMFGPNNPDFYSWPPTEIKDFAANHKGAMRTGPFGSNLLHGEFSESGDVAVLGIDNAVQNKFAWGEKRFITKEKYKSLSNYRIFPGDVIVTIMGTIGRSAVVPDDIPLAINTKHLAAITLDTKKANPKFLSYSIHSNPNIVQQFKNKNRGAIMSGLNLGIIKETKIRRPPVDLQNHFAFQLDKVEYLRTLYQQSLSALENLYGALSQKAFKGELDLSRIPLEKKAEPQMDANGRESEALALSFDHLDHGAMSDPAAREKLLRRIFEEYFTGHPRRSFSFKDFWARVEFNVLDHMDEESPPLGVGDYNQIKALLFDWLKSGQVDQRFNEKENQMELRTKP
jgi:type I restriction enzyme S subunit